MNKFAKIFGKDYACAYDFLYKEKNYKKECDFIGRIFQANSLKPKRILDLGCGTGGHALILAKRGFKVIGVDRSKEMLAIAQNKAIKKGLDIEFINQDITRLSIKHKPDAVIAMFAVMGYQTDNRNFTKICNMVKKLLPGKGLFIFDCWNGYAVIHEKPGKRIKKVRLGKNERITRFTEPVLNILNHTVETRFKVLKFKNGHLCNETFEPHLMRFWFPQEIKHYLMEAGFRRIDFCPFLRLNEPLTERHWNMTVIAQA